MEEKSSYPIVREVGENYEISVEDATCFLHQCWCKQETTSIKSAEDKLVKCSTMARRAVQKMLHTLNIGTDNREAMLDAHAIHYLVRLAYFGTTAYKEPKLKFFVDDEVVNNARKETIKELQSEYGACIGEVQIQCIDGAIPVHEGVISLFKVASSGTSTLPISKQHLSVVTDLLYNGKTSFKRSELAAVYVATTFSNFKEVKFLVDELRRTISNNWKSALSIDCIRALNSVYMTILCSQSDFVADDNRVEIVAALEAWAESSLARQTVKYRLVFLLEKNSTPNRIKDYTKFIYYNGYKFDGTLWTESELHKESSKRFTYTNAVVNSEGDRIVSVRPGPIGILSTVKGFTRSTYLPHDPLGYGFPYTFQQYPYVCLVFNIYDDELKHYGTELWQWKEQATFEPIKTLPMWESVGNMVRIQDDCFYLTGKRRHCGTRRGPDSVGASVDDKSHENKAEAGLYLMKVTRIDGVLMGEVKMIEKWTLDEYCEKFNTEFFCIGETLYKQERNFNFNECKSSPTVLSRLENDKFVPAGELQPIEGAMLTTWTLGGRIYAVASLYDVSNTPCPCGFFELTDMNVWRDRTLETGFFNVHPKWKPANNSAWRDFVVERT